MSKIRIIRKGSYKSYLKPAVNGGAALAVIVFLLSLIDNSVWASLSHGLGLWAFFFLIFALGFFNEEYYERKKKLKYVQTPLFDFLHLQDFMLNEDFNFKGTYKEHHFIVLTLDHFIQVSKRRRKRIKIIHIITPYTFPDINTDYYKREQELTGFYNMGHVEFANNQAHLIPSDMENVDFEACFKGMIGLLQREGLKPGEFE